MTELTAKGIVVNRTAESIVCSGCCYCCNKRLGNFYYLSGAACEIDLYFCKVDTFEQYCKVFGSGNLEAKRSHTLGEYIECYCICFLGSLGDDILAGKPVILCASTAYIGVLTGE